MSDPGLVARRWRPRWSGRLLTAMGVAALLVACGEDPAPTGIPDSSVPDALPGTPAEVEEALLTTDDLGEGWTDLGAVPFGERSFPECPETGVVTDGEDPTMLGEAQSHYGEGDPPVPTFGVSISLWESADVARQGCRRWRRFPRSAAPSTSSCRRAAQPRSPSRSGTDRR